STSQSRHFWSCSLFSVLSGPRGGSIISSSHGWLGRSAAQGCGAELYGSFFDRLPRREGEGFRTDSCQRVAARLQRDQGFFRTLLFCPVRLELLVSAVFDGYVV